MSPLTFIYIFRKIFFIDFPLFILSQPQYCPVAPVSLWLKPYRINEFSTMTVSGHNIKFHNPSGSFTYGNIGFHMDESGTTRSGNSRINLDGDFAYVSSIRKTGISSIILIYALSRLMIRSPSFIVLFSGINESGSFQPQPIKL